MILNYFVRLSENFVIFISFLFLVISYLIPCICLLGMLKIIITIFCQLFFTLKALRGLNSLNYVQGGILALVLYG